MDVSECGVLEHTFGVLFVRTEKGGCPSEWSRYDTTRLRDALSDHLLSAHMDHCVYYDWCIKDECVITPRTRAVDMVGGDTPHAAITVCYTAPQ